MYTYPKKMSQPCSPKSTLNNGGTGDNRPLTIRVIDTSIPSQSTIHKLSRGEICNTLTNLRTYLKVNASDKNALPTPLAISTSKETVKSGISSSLGFLAFTRANSLQTQELLPRTHIGHHQRKKLPWVLESTKNSLGQNTERNSAEGESRSRTGSSTPSSVSKNLCETPSQQSLGSCSGENTPKRPSQANFLSTKGDMLKSSAIERFQKFLKRTKKPPLRVGVKVCIQPEISPEVRSAITASYNRHYGKTNAQTDIIWQPQELTEMSPTINNADKIAFLPEGGDATMSYV
ncbi:uncharacterized protein LOC118434326 [Folsomia candida]|uniref:uncharacterized protein LOC118434326 n=1 Tax=Folsomia candida TaxID=158441 RepID=UPI001604D67C|nr:uncharacterized protein LOC118434326 [Folsomia candida]